MEQKFFRNGPTYLILYSLFKQLLKKTFYIINVNFKTMGIVGINHYITV